jgi:hypothetical protein
VDPGGNEPTAGGLTTARNLGGPTVVDLDLTTTTLGSLGTLGWTVPGLVSVPGFLLLLAIAGQALGGLVWVPVARRKLGGFGLRRVNERRLRH